jgi:gamma-glutamyl:cysteine ligase YbdK (ATP-grasp superfamily)
MNLKKFKSSFGFRKELTGFIGIERERFLFFNGLTVPQAPLFLKYCSSNWTYELSSCQVEDRTNPKKELNEVKKELEINDREGKRVGEELGFSLENLEVGPKDMSLEVYPNKRYLQIIKSLSLDVLSAACRVTGTHIHIGMPDLKTAISCSNLLRHKKYFDRLCQIGDHSDGQRLNLYKLMANDWYPPYYRNERHFFEVAKKKGFVENPRNCWNLIRISVHGTLELRMFGSTSDINEILSWVRFARSILYKKELL